MSLKQAAQHSVSEVIGKDETEGTVYDHFFIYSRFCLQFGHFVK